MSFRRHLIVTLLLSASAAFAQEKKAEPAAPAAPAAAPADFTFGGDIRLRYEAYDSVQTLNSDAPFHIRDYFRLRTRLWANYNFMPNLSVYGRLAAEPRYWFDNSTVASEGKEWKYALVDNLYAKWSSPQSDSVPLTVVAGRQDIQLGDQWLVSDGTPVDGSWTNFFDGARATIDVKSIKTKFDVMLFGEQAHPSDTLPMVGRKGTYTVTEQDEVGAILYASNKTLKNILLDGYFIFKEDHKVASAGNNGDTDTLGVRIAGTPSAHWQYSAEGAYQWGRRDLQVRYPVAITGKRDIAAYGFNSKLTYLMKDSLSNQFTFLAEYLSGDDPSTTGKDEMFDVLWGRYPRVGETWAAAYSLESGGRTSQFQNLFRTGVTWTISPTKTSSIATTYCAMFAPEEVPTRTTNATLFSRSGHFRGHMLQVVAKQKFTKAINGLLFLEGSFLGDYYTHHDTITFVRAEVMYTF